MEVALFWLACAAVWLYFRVTTRPARRQALHSFWTLVLISGAAGFAWELLNGG